jgi:hypothetical protein
MNIEHLDRVTALRNHREKALELRKAAACGPIEFVMWFGRKQFDPFSVVSAEPVRQAVVDACTDFIVQTEAELKSLGVAVANLEPEPSHDAAYWRRTAEMYGRAWLRSLGGKLLPKTHFIDALVLTTEKVVKDATAATALKASAEADDAIFDKLNPVR